MVSVVAAWSRVSVNARVLVPESVSVMLGVSEVSVYFPSWIPLVFIVAILAVTWAAVWVVSLSTPAINVLPSAKLFPSTHGLEDWGP